jgi:hypothetical protein
MGGLVSSMPLKRPYRTKFRVFSWEAEMGNGRSWRGTQRSCPNSNVDQTSVSRLHSALM